MIVHVIVQAILSAIFAAAADAHGRRPILLVAYLIYTLGGLGFVLNDVTGWSYTGLLLLRAMESLGASVCASIANGAVSDVHAPMECGSMTRPTIGAANIGTVLGPTLGSLIASRTGNAA
ncbi:hypothetical protein S40285_05396 [Stachybotrys chlorohalonatus IBT 40285]|uniref:Major facilitator superfamily (MFS) profile domain-containing protein n=1 Tax=Stachybotrys chlorohalonatus (strain IBT 40285) TaxID=1283841 RepID=A0A084QX31_STAC4|nr:hypothetical protein S40285_05396 [Stachybotrys chlorohalonata IBT 40285]